MPHGCSVSSVSSISQLAANTEETEQTGLIPEAGGCSWKLFLVTVTISRAPHSVSEVVEIMVYTPGCSVKRCQPSLSGFQECALQGRRSAHFKALAGLDDRHAPTSDTPPPHTHTTLLRPHYVSGRVVYFNPPSSMR